MMEQQQLKRCPIGIQTFKKVIEGNYLYIDKTEYIYRMVHGASHYYFLNRPRRFGKTLYVIELKLDKSADAAMTQINLKKYPERFALSGLPVVKVGINFDAGKHTLGDRIIEE